MKQIEMDYFVNFTLESTPITHIFHKIGYFGCPPAGEAGDFDFSKFGDA